MIVANAFSDALHVIVDGCGRREGRTRHVS